MLTIEEIYLFVCIYELLFNRFLNEKDWEKIISLLPLICYIHTPLTLTDVSLGTFGDPGSCGGERREHGGDVEEKDEAGCCCTADEIVSSSPALSRSPSGEMEEERGVVEEVVEEVE